MRKVYIGILKIGKEKLVEIYNKTVIKLNKFFKNNSVYDEFTAIVLPMFEAMISNDIQNQQLAELRDTLLPKLMGGELSI